MANKTVNDIYGMADDLLRQDGASTGIPGLEESRTIEWINDLHKQFFEEFTDAGRNLPDYMKQETGFTGVVSTALAADIASGASSLTIDSSSYLDSSGAAVLYKNGQYDVFTFSGNTGGNVTGVSGVNFAHDEDEKVQKLYALPSTFGRMRIERDRGEGVRLNGRGFVRVPDTPFSSQYALWQNPTSSAWYLWMPQDATGDILVTFDKKPTELTTATGTTGTIDIPSQYSDHWYLVWGLVAIFRQVLDEDYVPQKERAEMNRIVSSAAKRGSVGRKLSGSDAYFRKSRSPSFPYSFGS